ncbi:hypothetical protein E2C01_003730 [Portunus trituberculatus]|uniref:Uncharacterized protein n=1 Tax=Portunus trituberculatus TaxID=210409 RepID=A0A5B7CN57_PORTR|nr:hypothetical protein [Portunus trituberculatus]
MLRQKTFQHIHETKENCRNPLPSLAPSPHTISTLQPDNNPLPPVLESSLFTTSYPDSLPFS